MPPRDFTETLGGLMARRGVCLRGLARQVPLDAGQLSRVLNGKRSPTDELAHDVGTAPWIGWRAWPMRWQWATRGLRPSGVGQGPGCRGVRSRRDP
jgi:lambda repressor-like predicted transcriptional regulator